MAARPRPFLLRRVATVTSFPAVRSAMAGESGGRRRSGSATPAARRVSGSSCAPLPPLRDRSPVAERPLTVRRSPRFHLQKENVPVSPAMSPTPPPSPPPTSVAPRVRRSYSRLEPSGTPRGAGGGTPLSPIPLPPPAPQQGPSLPPLPPPGGAERKRKKKLPPIDVGQLEAWAAAMNRQFEEAERFRLVVE